MRHVPLTNGDTSQGNDISEEVGTNRFITSPTPTSLAKEDHVRKDLIVAHRLNENHGTIICLI